MTSSFPRNPSPAERTTDVPRILRAMQKAVREALEQHRQAGHPVAVWRDGRVVWSPANEIPVEPAEPEED